jgi:hypothetical protein
MVGSDMMTMSILDRPSVDAVRPALPVGYPRPEPVEWKHPATEGECVVELVKLLRAEFDLYREVQVEHRFYARPLRVDLLAIKRDVTLAFEVKSSGFKLAWALRQARDYVGADVTSGTAIAGKKVQACFVYPIPWSMLRGGWEYGMIKLAEYDRVGVGYINPYNNSIVLGFANDTVWSRQWGWSGRAERMLFGARQFGGKRERMA